MKQFIIILLIGLLSCSTKDEKVANKIADEIESVKDEKVIKKDVSIDNPAKLQEKETVSSNPNHLEFISNQSLKSGKYHLLKMVYIPNKDNFFIEFGDSTSFTNQNNSYEITFQVFPSHLTFNETIIKFYGHSGELGEVQAHLIMHKDKSGNYESMQGDISFLSNRFKEVVLTRTSKIK